MVIILITPALRKILIMTQNLLPKQFVSAQYQYADKNGKTYKIHELSHEDLVQVACELIEVIEDLDTQANAMTQMISRWRNGEVILPAPTDD